MRRARTGARNLWPFSGRRPWGEDLTNGGEEAGFIIANIDPGLIGGARAKMPPQHNDQKYRPA